MKIIYPNENGGVSVVIPSQKYLNTLKGMTEIEKMTFIAQKDIPANTDFQIIEDNQVPTDRSFRNAWEYKNKSIEISLPKAREITKARLREEREPLLSALDIKQINALTEGVDTTDIMTEKQRLKDITDTVDSVTTLAGLKAVSTTKTNITKE